MHRAEHSGSAPINWVREDVTQEEPPASWASLVVQWVRIHLPMQETWVQSLVQRVWDDASEQLSPGRTATEPLLQTPGAATTEAHAPSSPCSATGGHVQQQRLSTAKKKPNTPNKTTCFSVITKSKDTAHPYPT